MASVNGIEESVYKHIGQQLMKHLPDIAGYLSQAQQAGVKVSPQAELAVGFLSMLAAIFHFGVPSAPAGTPPPSGSATPPATTPSGTTVPIGTVTTPPTTTIPPSPSGTGTSNPSTGTTGPVQTVTPNSQAAYYTPLSSNPATDGTARQLGFLSGDQVRQLANGAGFAVWPGPSAGVLHAIPNPPADSVVVGTISF
jgi:hypothetical protein